MGVDYCVYIGPYIEVPASNKPSKEVTVMYPGCQKCNVARNGKFCVDCGDLIVTLTSKEKEEIDPEEIIEEYDLKGQIEYSYDDDDEVWMPIYEDMFFISMNIKYEKENEDLTDINIQDEIAEVEKHCDKALKTLEKFYGVKPVVKWGLRVSVG
jgi:hypothetical protein